MASLGANDEVIDMLLPNGPELTIDLIVHSWRHFLRSLSRAAKPFNDHRIELLCHRTITGPDLNFYAEPPTEFCLEIRNMETPELSDKNSWPLTTAERIARDGQNASGILCYYPPLDGNGETRSRCWGYLLFNIDTINSITLFLNLDADKDIQLSITLATSPEGEKIEGFLELNSSENLDTPRSHFWARPGPVLLKQACVTIAKSPS